MVQLALSLVRQSFVLLQQLVIGLLYALPYIFGLLLATAGASLKVTGDALRVAFKGLSDTAERLSCEWTRRAINADFPYLWERQLKEFFYAISVLGAIGIWLLILFAPGFLIILLM